MFPDRFGRGVRALAADGFAVRALPSCAAADGVTTLAPRAIADELHGQLVDPECAGVVAAVGGWTMVTVLPHIDFGLVAEAAKPIIGYSDLSLLLTVVSARSDLVTFHGPMVVSEWGEAGGPWEYTRDQFRLVTGGVWSEHTVVPAPVWSDEMLWWDKEDTRRRTPNTGGERARTVSPGDTVEGTLWGGSLGALSLLAGTPFWEVPAAAIVFLETEAIAPDEFAARLQQLRLAGVFDHAAGVVLGKIGRPRACLSGFADYDEVVRDIVPPGLPVAAGYDIGHPEPMTTLPVGGLARLTCPTGRAPDLTLLGPH
ncbi:microcin C7 immunity protein [Actinophytocola oryzae]|uniref:Microcin C7 immunity protein n=2 Tax=Actinophytocola oryzae TaxID=502181 RepID=A0A4R7VHY8_9PSEU|nr:microcin C7 immunity protein [Actinophytocola oryzae]